MAVTIVEEARPVTRRTAITGGVDAHADTHVAAALDPVGGLLGVREFPATAAGYAGLLGWLGGFGTVALVGIEGTGSYGAGLARHVTAAGIRVVEVDRSDRQDRRRQGKSDPLDAVSAARAAQSGRARGAPKGRDGAVEAIRALMVARRSAAGERTRTINQARALILTGPDDLRARFTRHTPAALVTGLASLRPRPGDVTGYAVRIALRELGRRAQFLDGQLERLDELIVPLVTAHAPGLLTVYGLGPRTAALLLIAAGDHPGRLRSEAAWAHLCGVAPIPASSGKVTRFPPVPGPVQRAGGLWVSRKKGQPTRGRPPQPRAMSKVRLPVMTAPEPKISLATARLRAGGLNRSSGPIRSVPAVHQSNSRPPPSRRGLPGPSFGPAMKPSSDTLRSATTGPTFASGPWTVIGKTAVGPLPHRWATCAFHTLCS
jgi:transposase